ncbi:MAG: tryptophan synthase subunit beta [Fusobacterium sp.]
MTKFGIYGGQYVPESLMNPLLDLERELKEALKDKEFMDEYNYYLKEYVGRANPLYYAKALSEKYKGAKIYLKREDLNHTGAHKINNVLGQVLLAKRMGKIKIIAETGAGQHGVAVATVATLMGMECRVFMGKEDVERQSLNVFKMKLLNAEVVSVTSGTSTLKDATNEAIKEWVRSVEDTFYVIGSVVGPHPYPYMVREFQKVIGVEARAQILEKEGRLPNRIYACIGGGSNAMGIFYPFVKDVNVQLIGAEAGGLGIESGKHAVVLSEEVSANVGVFQGMKSILLTDENGNIIPAHSISAGLDYPGVGPEHAYLKSIDRAVYKSITDEEALVALKELSSVEGIIPAIESSHAVALALKEIGTTTKDDIIIINISGRGDKDMNTIMDYYENNDIHKLNK